MNVYRLWSLAFIIPALLSETVLAQADFCKQAYVWQFSDEDGEETDLAQQLRDEVSEVLSHQFNCVLLQRGKFADILAHIDNEAAIHSANSIPTEIRQQFVDAKIVIFGTVIQDYSSGVITLKLSFEKLETAEIIKASSVVLEDNDRMTRKNDIALFIDEIFELGIIEIAEPEEEGEEEEEEAPKETVSKPGQETPLSVFTLGALRIQAKPNQVDKLGQPVRLTGIIPVQSGSESIQYRFVQDFVLNQDKKKTKKTKWKNLTISIPGEIRVNYEFPANLAGKAQIWLEVRLNKEPKDQQKIEKSNKAIINNYGQLSAPSKISPATGTIKNLKGNDKITFSWKPVDGARKYILTVNYMDKGKIQVQQKFPVKVNGYSNLSYTHVLIKEANAYKAIKWNVKAVDGWGRRSPKEEGWRIQLGN